MTMRLKWGDRHELESELTATELESLHAICAVACIPPELWHRSRAIAPQWEVLACARRAARYRAEGRGKFSLQEAAEEMGLAPGTIANRLRRWGCAVYVGRAKPMMRAAESEPTALPLKSEHG
jgi:hypothetical protein